MKNVSLYCTENGHNKEYHIQLELTAENYIVNFQYGAIGSALKAGTKTPLPVSLEEAEKIYSKLLKEKTAKGYSEGEKKNDFSEVNQTQRKEVIILPQLLNTIEDPEEFINDDGYLAQPKFDGERRMVISNNGIVIGLNKKGTEVPLPKDIINSLKVDCIIDGEIIGNVLYAFDLLSFKGKDCKNLPCIDRFMLLFKLKLENQEHIEVAITSVATSEKRALYEKLKTENAEGIVFKKKDSHYTHGRPASGGNALKFKFQKSGTFIVKNLTQGKRSVGLELIDRDKRVFMGKVSVPVNHELPNIGELVEVQYLYAYKGGAIFQPVYKGKREDSDLTDATMTQIVYKAD